MIDRCTFGTMTIDGRQYTSDLMIFPDGRVIADWWRASGHRLTIVDMRLLIDARPELIVAGMGIYGRMQAETGLHAMVTDRGIELITQPTEAAAQKYNEALAARKRVAGCFHLTC